MSQEFMTQTNNKEVFTDEISSKKLLFKKINR